MATTAALRSGVDEHDAPVVLFAQGVDAGVQRGAASSVGWSASTRASSTASGRGRSTAGPANSTHPRFAAKEIEGRGQGGGCRHGEEDGRGLGQGLGSPRRERDEYGGGDG